ncbi:MAG: DUF3592 domain-containing protein [Anaerolineales bacterium]|nr:DUF3592 domain-containing protein [Anaerolineales bacterium]
MINNALRRVAQYLLISGGLLILLALMLSGEWRDWQDSSSWQHVTTSDFTIQPKNSSARYRYIVDGQQYEGGRIYFFVLARFQDDRVLRWLEFNRQAEELTVYYDPDLPQRSVLVRGGLEDPWFLQFPIICGVAGLFVLIPVVIFGSLWRWLQQQFPN